VAASSERDRARVRVLNDCLALGPFAWKTKGHKGATPKRASGLSGRRRSRHCPQHQLTADIKADGKLDSSEISAALGHLSDAKKSTYGQANMYKGRGLAPARVTAVSEEKVRAAVKTRPSLGIIK
jgi:hypothetical protein